MTEGEWLVDQQRRQNLASFQAWPAEKAPRFDPSPELVAFAVSVIYGEGKETE